MIKVGYIDHRGTDVKTLKQYTDLIYDDSKHYNTPELDRLILECDSSTTMVVLESIFSIRRGTLDILRARKFRIATINEQLFFNPAKSLQMTRAAKQALTYRSDKETIVKFAFEPEVFLTIPDFYLGLINSSKVSKTMNARMVYLTAKYYHGTPEFKINEASVVLKYAAASGAASCLRILMSLGMVKEHANAKYKTYSFVPVERYHKPDDLLLPPHLQDQYKCLRSGDQKEA